MTATPLPQDEVIRMARKAGLHVGTNISGVMLVGSPSTPGIAHIDIDEMAAFAAVARADLEAENQRLREALTHAVEIAEGKRPGTWDDLLQYRAALESKP